MTQAVKHPPPRRYRCALLLMLVCAAPALAGESAPQMGRYLPLYPGLYFNGGYAQDDQDSSYDRNGRKRDSAVPTVDGKTRFVESRYEGTFTWFFPLFESDDLPFFSSRLHTARVHLSYVKNKTQGALAGFVANTVDDARTDADNLRNNGSGIGDLQLEFGSVLYGSGNWRERQRTPFAVLALIGLNLPLGHYDRDAPVSAGSNTAAAHVRLGLHAQPWGGGFADAGFGYREYFKNQDAAFGALAPTDQGSDRFWDASLAQRLLPGFYVTAFASGRNGGPNVYDNPRFAPNAPPPPNTTPPSDNFPARGRYLDGGTALRSAGLSLSYFLSQRWLAGLHYTRPLSGKSGQFDLPYTNRLPAGCTVGATGCQTSAGGTVTVDGMGAARAFASDSLMFTLGFNFGQGDAFTCTGCEN